MRFCVIHPRELDGDELRVWRRLQREQAALMNPFLSPNFAMAVGRVRDMTRVTVLEDAAGRPVGFFPHERRALGVGRPIGAGVCDCQALIHEPGLEWDPVELLAGCRLAVWEFDHLLAAQAPFAPYHIGRDVSPVMDLSQGYQRYLEDRRPSSKRLIKGTLYQRRRLGREVGEVRFDPDVRDPAELRLLMAWKSAQYQRTGRFDRFAREWIVRLVEELFETRSETLTGCLSMLYAADRPISGSFDLRCGSVLASWFPAYDPEFARYSPGRILMLEVAELAPTMGVSLIDLGRASRRDAYKQSFKSFDVPIAEGWVERRSAVALLRRAERTPARAVRGLVARHKPLWQAADYTLQAFGQLRSRFARSSSPSPGV